MEQPNPEQAEDFKEIEKSINVEQVIGKDPVTEKERPKSCVLKQIDPRDTEKFTSEDKKDKLKRALTSTDMSPKRKFNVPNKEEIERPDIKQVKQSSFKPKKKNTTKNSKDGSVRENKELEWFSFENRVRDIIKDILEPYAIRSIDLQEAVENLTEGHDRFKRKQDEMEFVMHKRSHRNSGIDELNKKLFDIENERKVREAKNMQAIQGLKVQLDSTRDRMTQIEELSLTFKKQANDIKYEVNGFFDKLTEFQERFSKEQLKYKEDMNKNFLTLRNQYIKTEELSKVNKNYINSHFDELKRHDMIVQSYQKNLDEIYKKIQVMDKVKINTNDFNDDLTKIKKDISHVRFLNEDVFQSVQLIDNYIEDFIPVKIEKQLKEFYSKMNQGVNQISPVYKYKQLFKKSKTNEVSSIEEDTPQQPGENTEESKDQKQGPWMPISSEYSSLGPKAMIQKYKTLTTNLEGQKEELDEMEENEIERIEKLLKEEKEIELDADKVVDYLINLIAYLNDEEEQQEKNGQIVKKQDISVKTLLKNRFQKAGFTKAALKQRRYTNRGAESQKNLLNNSKHIRKNTVLKSNESVKRDDSEDDMSYTPIRSGFSNIDAQKNPKSVDFEQEKLTKENQRRPPPYHDKLEQNYRKLKIEDLEEDTAELIFKALDDVKEIKESVIIEKSMIEETMKDLKSNFAKEREVLDAKFESNKRYLQKYAENIQKDFEEELVRRNREKSNFSLKINDLEAKVDNLKNHFDHHDSDSENMAETVNLLVQTAMINHSMELQDETDREKLALMGYKEERPGLKTASSRQRSKPLESNGQYVNLDKQCMTCSGQSSVVMKAFKIACLAYKPTPVVFPQNGGSTHTRIDLINLKGRMLEKLETIAITKSMRKEGANPQTERNKLFNMYLKGVKAKNSQKDLTLNSLFHTRQPKVTIRTEAMSSSSAVRSGSQMDMANKLNMKYQAEDFIKKNVTMLTDKTLALSRNPFNEKGVKKIKKGVIGSNTMSLPKIQTARNLDRGSLKN
ncbi:unnamed protein product [Moneuplotes crassus]|uniref:Uncharacterized protein n=1 Tax=Euplotes crassus TaxID=5936 RepID=A0AAD1UTW5_EUPCR|nr:unnamed protein product [Moneuplotes crassus]